MKTYIDQRIDRKDWGRGEWDGEPDKVVWKDEATGLPCIAKRNHMGAWCGYVGVSEGHIAFEKPYDRVDVSVHGGLTYADHCQQGPESETICHVPEPGEPNHVWWLGFDCSHSQDTSPGFLARGLGRWPGAWYKTLQYVQRECAQLAAQLAALTTLLPDRDAAEEDA
jgi:hypothetical protein